MRLGLIGAVIAFAACGRIGFTATGGVGDDAGDDAGGSNTDATPACATTGWGNFVHQTNLASSSEDWEPTLSPDGLNIIFSSDRNAGSHLYFATRSTIDGAFGVPTQLMQITSADGEYAPQWSRDGTQLYWHHHAADFIFHYERVGIASVGATISLDLASRVELGQTTDRDSFTTIADEREVFYTLGKPSRKDIGWSTKPTNGSPFSTYSEQTLPSTFNGTVAAFDDGWPTFDDTRQELWWERDDASAGTTALGPRILSATRSGGGMPFDSAVVEHPELGIAGDPDVDADGLALALSADMTQPPAGLPNVGQSDIYTATRTCR
ncbi:MAG TPA: hypothetical protein VGM90_10025 [Kofleriaceae bacterium]